MKRYSFLFIASTAWAALRNPFELILPEHEKVIDNIHLPEQVSVTANSTWQITKQEEQTVFLQNQQGEIRHVQLAADHE